MKKLILASGSPRRKEIMELVGLDFEVICSDADENITEDVPPDEFVRMLALRKAEAVVSLRPQDVIVAADTIVEIDGQILGKPKDRQEAVDMLRGLSGREHRVYTGVAVVAPEEEESFVCCTKVKFINIDQELLNRYVDCGEPMDKAGAYGIQGKGAVLVEKIEGDYFNVMGLPISLLYAKIRKYL